MRAAATIWLCVLAAPGVQAAGFGPPEGTLPIHPLSVAVPAGALSPLRSSALFHEESSTGAAPTYYLGAGVAGSRLTTSPWEAVGLALIPGVAKELYDAGQACNRFSWKDMGWSVAGAVLGVGGGYWMLGPSGVSWRMGF